MKRILLFMSLMVAFLSNAQALFADDNASTETTDPTKQGVITTPPAGDERHYYLDLLNLDPYDGGLGLFLIHIRRYRRIERWRIERCGPQDKKETKDRCSSEIRVV